MGDFNYLECRIGPLIGLSDSLIKKTRRDLLERDEDFKLAGGRIAYTSEGVAKLLGFLQAHPDNGKSRKSPAPVDMPELLAASLLEPVLAQNKPVLDSPRLLSGPYVVPDAVLLVVRLYPRNRKIMLGRLAPDWIEKNGFDFFHRTGIDPRAATHRIMVNSTKKFVVGMEVPCRWRQADLWECTRRMPYRKGRWE